MPIDSTQRTLFRVGMLSLSVLAGCKSKSTGNELAGRTASAGGNVATVPADTTRVVGTMGAMHDTARMKGMPGMVGGTVTRPTPRDSNEAFLRMMSDHHQGLIMMTDTAMSKLGPTARADAQKMRSEQTSEQQKMLRMLSTQYKDSITPTLLPSNQQMISAVAGARKSDADQTFYKQVIAHHQEGVQMTAQMLPQLTGEARQMAIKSVAQQKKEIADFQKKMSARR